MNILFLNTFKATKNASGGIARVTINLSRMFTDKGHICRLAYYLGAHGDEDDCFAESLQLETSNERKELERLASISDLFIIQIQMSKKNLYLLGILNDLRSKYGIKTVYCHHSKPFVEKDGYDLNYLVYLVLHSTLGFKKRITESLCCIYAGLFPELATRRIAMRRQLVADKTDMVVLLSNQFVPSFRKYVRIANNKLTGIGNSVTFDHNICAAGLEQKEKSVVIVANMTERAKRVSMALKIWHILSQRHDISDWSLNLVGDGEDLEYYKGLAKKYGLNNCKFVGRQDPLEFYKKSRILMLTSAYEGFGMVVLEAQQMGCVPIVFNTYESVHDLIEDGSNGLLIKYREYSQYADALYNLMSNHEHWYQIASNCIKVNERFTTEGIFNEWQKMFVQMGLIKE